MTFVAHGCYLEALSAMLPLRCFSTQPCLTHAQYRWHTCPATCTYASVPAPRAATLACSSSHSVSACSSSRGRSRSRYVMHVTRYPEGDLSVPDGSLTMVPGDGEDEGSTTFYDVEAEDMEDEEMMEEEVDVVQEDGSMGRQTVSSLIEEYNQWINETLGQPGYIWAHRGRKGQAYVQLNHPNGSSAQVYLHGACITSWKKPNGVEMLHVLPSTQWDGQDPIRGGIPVCFPQYRRGVLPTNGFLQKLHWDVAEALVYPEDDDPGPTVVLHAEHDEETLSIWPFKFQAFYGIRLGLEDDEPDMLQDPNEAEEEVAQRLRKEKPKAAAAQEDDSDDEELEESPEDDSERSIPPCQLTCTLAIRNVDDKPFTFQAALASTFAVQPSAMTEGLVRTLGLGGKYMLDWAIDDTGTQPVLRVEDEDYLVFGEERVDRLYVDAAVEKGQVFLCPGDRSHVQIIHRKGFKDVAAFHQDPKAAEARKFVTLPSARVARTVTLYPGEVWVGEVALRAFDYYWEAPIWERGLSPMPPPKMGE